MTAAAGSQRAAMDWLPAPLAFDCNLTPRGGSLGMGAGDDAHVHEALDEICLVANDGTRITHGGVERTAAHGSLFLFRRGERHGFRNRPEQEPHLWVVHYQPDEALYAELPVLAERDAERRVWKLDAGQVDAFQALFMRMQAERLRPEAAGHRAALAAWLRLILLALARWRQGREPSAPAAPAADPALARLWEVIHEHVERPDDLAGALARRVPNYDSLRHRFRRVVGLAPRDLLGRLRLQRAQHLLLDTGLTVSAIAERLGYRRVHEFTRAFHRATGRPPTEWRRAPGVQEPPRIR